MASASWTELSVVVQFAERRGDAGSAGGAAGGSGRFVDGAGGRARADPADRIVVVAPEQCWSVANTQKAYATDLKDYFQFLDQQQIDWRTPSLEVIGE